MLKNQRICSLYHHKREVAYTQTRIPFMYLQENKLNTKHVYEMYLQLLKPNMIHREFDPF